VIATNELSKKSGLAFFGRGAAWMPFSGGTLCVQAPLVRTPVQSSGGSKGKTDCTGVYDFDVSYAWLVEHRWSVGDELFAQFWSRDSRHPDGTGAALSNALRFTLQL
jgi:hypothetical protein